MSKITNSVWFYPLLIFGSSLYASLIYSLRHFEIVSDSAIEYQTYLIYIQQGHWSPIVDNMLSTSLWTTYLPSIIQNVIHLQDPAITYRLTLALLVSPAPLLIYILTKKYTSQWVALSLAIVFFTSFYYQSNVAYARTIVGLEMVIITILLYIWHSRWKWTLIPFSAVGLVIAHYTTTYLWIAMFIGSGLLLLIISMDNRKKLSAIGLMAIGCILLAGTLVWYNGHSESRAFGYAYNAVIEIKNETSDKVDRIITGSNIPEVKHIRSYAIDMMIAQGLLGLRVVISAVICWLLYREKKLLTPIGVLMIGRIIGLILSFSIINVEELIGILRVGFIVFPIELLGIAYWYGKERKSSYIIPTLGIMSVIYH